VTGIHGNIEMMGIRFTNIFVPSIGPDYIFQHGLYQATPGGAVSTIWRNETIIESDKYGNHIWHNPWGYQPY
jgi:hypothetical protein